MKEQKHESLLVELISPELKLFEGKAKSLLVPSEDGDIFILPSHLPMICALKKGTIILYLEKKEQKKFEISPGILEIDNDKVKIIVETAQSKIAEESVI